MTDIYLMGKLMYGYRLSDKEMSRLELESRNLPLDYKFTDNSNCYTQHIAINL